MPISAYLKDLRSLVGARLLLVQGVAAIIHDREGRVLLQRRSDDGSWSLPAGGIDPGEAPAQAMVREVWEETGLRVVPERLLGVFGGKDFHHLYPNGDEVEVISTVFGCRVVGGSLGGRDGESLELRYFAPDALPDSGLLKRYPPALFEEELKTPLFAWDERWLEALEPEVRSQKSGARRRVKYKSNVIQKRQP